MMNPEDTIIINVTLNLAGLNSPASAIALGMMAPIASPVTKRSTKSLLIVEAYAVANMPIARNSIAAISTGRRPILSATMLRPSDPIMMPRRPAPNTGPSAVLVMCQSLISAGAT